MRTGRFKGGLLATLVIASLMVPAISLLSVSPSSAAPEGLTPHAPIYIEGNDNFTPANGVTSGSGTADDPYIIENWAIDASTAHGIWIKNTTKYFVIRNCLVENGSNINEIPLRISGIFLEQVWNGRIENCTCLNNFHGIRFDGYCSNNTLFNNNTSMNNICGIKLGYSSNTTLANNTCSNNGWYEVAGSERAGIELIYSNNNTLENNICLNNYWFGIRLLYSENTKMQNNVTENNRYNFSVEGWYLQDFYHDIDTSNLVNGKPIRYLKDNSDEVIGPSLEMGYLALVHCDNIRVKNLVLEENNGEGILLAYTENSWIYNNTCSNNYEGIRLTYSVKNTLSNNICSNNNNNGSGICLSHHSNNNTLENNICSNSSEGISIRHSTESTLSNNKCYNNMEGIFIQFSKNNTLNNNTCSNIYNGIIIYSSENDILSNNTCSNHYDTGISLDYSNNSTLDNNTCSNNYEGIILSGSSNNTIFHNYLLNNTYNAWDEGTNYWDDGYPSGGNYWSDWQPPTRPDANNDGIVDEPYPIPGGTNQDRYPLVIGLAPEDTTPPTCAIELRRDGMVIDEINVGEFFDIYVGDSTDDTGIKEARFSSDDFQDGNPTGEWTNWYGWNTSSGDWNDDTKIKKWSFATSGNKEVWAEIRDDGGNFDNCHATIFIHPGYAIIVAGQGGWREKWGIDHAANNAYRVLRNLGFDDDHIFYLNSNILQDIDGDGNYEVDAPALLNHFKNTINEVKERIGNTPIPFILYLTGHGLRNPDCFIFDEDDPTEGYLWVSDLQEMLGEFSSETPMPIVIGSCYSGCFITSDEGISAPNRIIITAAHDDWLWGERLYLGWIRNSDRFWGNLNKGLNVKEAFVKNAWPGDILFSWLDDDGDRVGHPPNNLEDDGELAASTRIGVPGTEDLELTPWLYVGKRSPGELRIYDSQSQVTGLVNGVVKEEIPGSIYDDQNEIVAIFSPSDTYRYEVVGTDEGTYGLDIALIEGGEITTFTATDIPTTSGATHQYTIDWDAFSEDEGVTLQIDSDGDGTFEQTFTADSELTHDEFMLQTATTIDFDPDTLNLKNKGKVVTVYIELPEGYSVENIDVSTVRLIVDNNNVPAEPRPTEIGDHDNDNIADLMVKFSRSVVQAIVGMGEVELTVTGLVNSTPFEGNDTIRVIKPGKADLEIRFMEIPLEWAMSPPKGKLEIEIEFSQIPFYRALAPD